MRLPPILIMLCLFGTAAGSELHVAARTCSLPQFKEVLARHSVEVNESNTDGDTALHEAVRAGKVECAAVLVRAGANSRMLNHAGISPADLANAVPEKKLRDSMNFALLGARQPAVEGLQPWTLEYAVLRGQLDVVRMLLQLGANPSLVGTDGNTPLHDACLKGQVEIAKLLIEKGAEVGARSKAGTLPLHDAAMAGNASIIALLLRNGAALNATTEATGETALHLAAAWGRVGALKTLLEAGANLEIRDSKMRTPLEAAVANSQAEAAAAIRAKLPR